MLLLTLLLQRKPNHVKETRAVFVEFFRIVTQDSNQDPASRHHHHHHHHRRRDRDGSSSSSFKECTCSAKVLQAFALFEMKQGRVKKAYSLAKMAVEMDPELEPLLRWKQFRVAQELYDH